MAVEEAMTAIHDQGIVHLDWYLSNFMWKVDEGNEKNLVLKIIDFDSCHAIDEPLSEVLAARLLGTRYQLADREPGGAGDLRNYDISLMKLLRLHARTCELLSSDVKSTLDKCLNDLQNAAVKSIAL